MKPLTPEEMEILRLVCLGDTNKEIAYKLNYTSFLINKRLTSIYKKLGVSSRHGAIIEAAKHGLVDVLDETAFDRLYKRRGRPLQKT